MLGPGDSAPVFTLPDVQGTPVTPAGRRLLVFFKISCPVCQLAQPFLNRLAARGLPVVLISQDDAELTPYFLRQFDVQAPTLIDDEAAGYPVSNAFGIDIVPSLFLINDHDVVEAATSGFVKADFAALGGPDLFTANDAVPEWRPGCGSNN